MSGFHDKALVAELTAQMLLEVQAVHFRADEPYRFTSGLASPVYIDCRKLISYPRLRNTLMDFAASTILQEVGFESLDAIAGGETAGIPFAAWIADRLSLPMLYVRKQAKGFGRDAQIEGAFADNERVLLVEDLTTDGRTKIRFCETLINAGLDVKNTFVLFNYGIFPETNDILARHGIRMHYLATWWDVLRAAKKLSYFDNNTLGSVENFLNSPLEWSSKNGGVANAGP